MADVLTEILRAASKHPNSRVSKLIHTVKEEPTQKNIVLLLIELAEHAEYSTDFNVSLKYYLDLFERLGINHDLVLNEAGLLLVNSSKIYSKRVDYVQSLVERQILTLSNADDELQKQKLEQQEQQAENATPIEKPKRGRKRALEVPTDPYEVELAPKKFKKLTEEKRFAQPKTAPKPKSLQRNIEMEQHIHPAGWLHATIYDLENEEDVDTKRNYKLFTYHVEHRYNTLVPDINFRLHFKVKDYMDEQEEMEEEEACNTDRTWPPLSEAYVQKYLRLENYVLQQDEKANKRKATVLGEDILELGESLTEVNDNLTTETANKSQPKLNKANKNESTMNDKNETVLEQSLLDASVANTSTNAENDSGLEQSLLDASVANTSSNPEEEQANKTQENLDTSNLGGKNDSGLGQSILDETNNTLESTQLNSTLETSTNPENLNDSTMRDDNKTLNTTESQQENDSALGTSVLDQTTNTEHNTTGNFDSTTNSESLNNTNLTETNKSLNITESQHENDSALSSSVMDQTSNTNGQIDTTAETSAILETSQKEEEDATATDEEENLKIHAEEVRKARENRKDSALSDDRHHSISTENLAMSRENLSKIDEEIENTGIDVNQQQDKDATQIRVQLPHADDEGVCLSDLEDHNDCRLLSPIIKATNILPGVERKDVTIYMDEELRQALEMRDGIMEHFGPETYKVPVITEAKKQNLLFNILKLPEKILRRKVIFKLGPEMDLYLQARSLKRSRPEPATRTFRNIQLLQWHSLNNTDMTGVCMTPPYSPGHCSDFCGFSDDEDNEDALSCAEFCGFTEEEQATMVVQNINRLSRDSGVGVDVNNLTPEKETLEIIFDRGETSAVENCKRNLNLDDTGEQSTESILKQLPEEIRDVLTTELEENNESTTVENSNETVINTEELDKVTIENTEETEKMLTESILESTEESEKLLTDSSLENTEETDKLLNESSTENSENLSSNNTQEEKTEKSESLSFRESQEKSNDNETASVIPNNTSVELTNTDVDMVDIKASKTEESSESSEELMKEKLNLTNSMKQSDNFDDHHEDVDNDDSDDDEMLDLDTQGTKTKIQQWHEHLQPILAKSRERHHFDVFQLGTEIIDTVQNKRKSIDEPSSEFESNLQSSNCPVATFHDIMDNKDQSYVSRYFLSTLLLANQSNIEISIDNKSSEKPSSWHDIHLKLLSTKRHTVAIEDNIGMIDNKQKAIEKNIKSKIVKEKQNKTSTNEEDYEVEDEPLIKLQSTKKLANKSKTSIKRHSDSTSPIAEKKPKQITSPTTNNQSIKLPNLIESVQIIKPPSATVNMMMTMPSTSLQAQNFNTALNNVNINAVRTLQPIEKVQKRSDDYDSGIFSIDEMSTS